MAGIGFVLRKLMKKRELSTVALAYFHATLASCGPWLFTVAALGSFFLIFKDWTYIKAVEDFRAVILYNFSFSLVISGPIVATSTRYLADLIYLKRLEDAPGLLLGSLIMLFAVSFPIVAIFYLFYVKISIWLALNAIANFMIVTGIWLLSVYISAVKYYKSVTFSFLAGMIIAVIAAISLGSYFSSSGMLAGFNVGLGFILAILCALVFAEYPKKSQNLFKYLKYFKKYWELPLSGLFYNLAIWVDKWIMWFAPEAETLNNGLIMYPDYDTAMFGAYLTIIPGLAMFLLSLETAFFEKYVMYFRSIQEHKNLRQIRSNFDGIIDTVINIGKNIFLLQICICVATLFSAPYLFNLVGLSYAKLGIFRFGVLGATFQIFFIFFSILLSYFDYRKGVLFITFMFFFTNACFTLVTLTMGFPYYGLGYFASTLVSFLLASFVFERHLQNLPYHTFLSTNPSVT
ncbi:MAG: exopolysaccharide Pel transporter PelG [Parachlamydiales bacterium]|jgi:uncharacterized membrane protein